MPIDLTRFEQMKTSGDLPSPKGVALAIMRLTQQEDVSMADLARIIRTDPAFVGRLIKAANGVIGPGRRPVASVQDALTVLGLPAVRAMALGFSLLTNYRAGACRAFDYGRFWSASLIMAITTQALAQRTRMAAADESYCLGLLARVGELALATLYPKEYAEVLEEHRAAGPAALWLAETRAVSMHHAELGAALLTDWGLPRIFTEAVFHYEDPESSHAAENSRERTVLLSLGIARQMAELCLAQPAERPLHLRRLYLLGSRLDFDETQMVALCDHVANEWVAWGALLNIPANRLPPFVHLEEGAGTQNAPAEQGAAGKPAPASEIPAEAPERPLRVLIADDESIAREAAAIALMQAGYEVAQAGDGHLAAEAALDFLPDVMVIDWTLAGMAGEELVRTLRGTRIGRGLYMLVLADDADEESQVRALDAGADDLLGRPVGAKLLLARIRSARRITELQREIEQDRDEMRHVAAELAVTNRRLHEAAFMDPLTGLPNRRFIAERAQQEWVAAAEHRRPLSCIVVDIDDFRGLNDRYGQEAGDTVLRGMAVAIRKALRGQDLIARNGGDEFLVLCPDTPLEAAAVCAERLRAAVDETELLFDGKRLHITLSIGVAGRDAAIADAGTLLKRAGASLEQAKHAGRNRVVALQMRPLKVGT